jgi:hypothetical protein
MSIIPKIARAMQEILTINADKRAEEAGFIKRQRKFTGSTFAQTLVFGWLNDPEATLESLTQTAADLGVAVSPQGLDKRFTSEAAEFVKLILEDTVSTLISADPVSISILQHFHGVYIKDSSIVMLPDELHDTWQGCGGRVMKNTRASVRVRQDKKGSHAKYVKTNLSVYCQHLNGLAITRFLSKSKFARPYIWRFISLSRLTWPSA